MLPPNMLPLLSAVLFMGKVWREFWGEICWEGAIIICNIYSWDGFPYYVAIIMLMGRCGANFRRNLTSNAHFLVQRDTPNTPRSGK